VRYSLPSSLPEWELPEVPVPESPEHDEHAAHLRSVLAAWLSRASQPGAVQRNLAIRWVQQNPKVGVDPDVCWVDTLPPGWSEGEIDCLQLWLPGHRVPRLAIEIVSRSHPYKDYSCIQDKYAVVGVDELWVYDPRKFGPRILGGPVLLQVWARSASGVLVRRHFADTPAKSELLGAWLHPRAGDHLVIADDPEGLRAWPTPQEVERTRAEQESARAKQESARAEREHARADQERARADALEAELQRMRERERGR
jgi:Uma2 family endonuclease